MAETQRRPGSMGPRSCLERAAAAGVPGRRPPSPRALPFRAEGGEPPDGVALGRGERLRRRRLRRRCRRPPLSGGRGSQGVGRPRPEVGEVGEERIPGPYPNGEVAAAAVRSIASLLFACLYAAAVVAAAGRPLAGVEAAPAAAAAPSSSSKAGTRSAPRSCTWASPFPWPAVAVASAAAATRPPPPQPSETRQRSRWGRAGSKGSPPS